MFHGNGNSIIEQRNSIGCCISADAKTSGGFAELLSQRIPGLRNACRRIRLSMGQVFPFWDRTSNRYIYNLVTKLRFSEKLKLNSSSLTLEGMKSYAQPYGISTSTIPKFRSGLDKMNLQEGAKQLRNIFSFSDIQLVVVCTFEENGVHALSSGGGPDFYADDEIEEYIEEFYLSDRDLETHSTREYKSSQPPCDEQILTLCKKEYNFHLIEYFFFNTSQKNLNNMWKNKTFSCLKLLMKRWPSSPTCSLIRGMSTHNRSSMLVKLVRILS